MRKSGYGLASGLLSLLLLAGCSGVTGGNNLNGSGRNTSSGNTTGDIHSINHIVIMLQENRSFDSYFGQMNAYRTANNFPNSVEDLGPNGFTNIGPDGPVTSYHIGTVCMENLSPDWAESHKMINLSDPSNLSNPKMDGFVNVAAGLAEFYSFSDLAGRRAMGYYTGTELNYYHFMASNFAMGDHFFSPMPGNTTPNRLYMFGATSQGYVHIPTAQLTAKTIWQLLTENNISWKIYITDLNPGNPTLQASTYLQFFNFSSQHNDHLAPLSQYFTDVAAGTLPSVAFIETGQFSGRDEHPSGRAVGEPINVINIQTGAKFISSIINALMSSPSWKDSVFFFAFDEGGGAFDHVPPASTVSPDGIPPRDLDPIKDVPIGGDFTITGFRVPNMVISPFAKKNFVSKTPMDYTAYLKFIETRFGLSPLTRRDAAQPDMTEFFDFTNGGPWATPPTPPVQNTNGVCDFSRQ